MHELAQSPPAGAGPNLELVQDKKARDPDPITVRCRSCNGLRSAARQRDTGALCPECRKGNVVMKTQFHNFWLERFSWDEIRDLGRAIWG